MNDNFIEPKVLHIDVENGWRGGQRQAIYLFENEIASNLQPHFVCKKYSELHKVLTENKFSHTAINYRNEFDIVNAYKIANIIRKNNYNIINCHSSHSLSLGLLSKLFYSKPKLIGVRRVDFKISNNIFSKWKYHSEKLNSLVCVSDAIKNIMKPYIKIPKKLITIHSGVEVDRFNNSTSDSIKTEFNIINKLIVGTIAAFADHKDYPTFLRTVKEISELRNDIQFIAVGDGELFEEIKNTAEKLNIAQNIIFTGFRNDIGDFLKAFDLFLFTSKEEGLGTSILDAMSVGLPIVATKAGGIPEIVKDRSNGILCHIGDEQSLAKAIIELADNQKLRKQYGQKSEQIVKDFSIEKTAGNYMKLYMELLSE